jgi:hypothetical protein
MEHGIVCFGKPILDLSVTLRDGDTTGIELGGEPKPHPIRHYLDWDGHDRLAVRWMRDHEHAMEQCSYFSSYGGIVQYYENQEAYVAVPGGLVRIVHCFTCRSFIEGYPIVVWMPFWARGFSAMIESPYYFCSTKCVVEHASEGEGLGDIRKGRSPSGLPGRPCTQCWYEIDHLDSPMLVRTGGLVQAAQLCSGRCLTEWSEANPIQLETSDTPQLGGEVSAPCIVKKEGRRWLWLESAIRTRVES